MTNLADILSKREYLCREYLAKNNKIFSLPSHFCASPNNSLFDDLKSGFFLTNSATFNNEFSRDIYYNSLSYFNYNIIHSLLNSAHGVFNFSFLNEYLFYYLFNYKTPYSLKNSQELLQNQYRPMRKGVTNMIRLHATGAIAMPIEVKLQILASSKDVIHS
jgi:hypothetical protein